MNRGSGRGHTGYGGERGLDLLEFDADAVHLHLEVPAAQILQRAVCGPAGQIAGSVQTGACRAERVCHESGSSQGPPIGIASGHLGPADVQLPGDSR